MHAWARSRGAVTLALLAIVAGGCAAPGGEGSDGGDPIVVGPPAPALDPILDAHNRRVELLATLSTRGSLEFRWVDADGDEHFEPGVEARLWIDLPRRAALRASKIEDLFWLGSDDERYWVFDMMEGETTLLVNAHATPIGSGSSVLVRPLELMDLVGLTPIPAEQRDAVASGATWDPQLTAWHVAYDGAGGPVHLWIDAAGRAVRGESRDAMGAVQFTCALDRYESVVVPGVSRAALPQFPTLLDVTTPDEGFRIRFGLDVPSPGANERVFDLERLIDHLRPVAVAGDRTP